MELIFIPLLIETKKRMKDIDLFFEAIRSGDKDRLEALLHINPKLVDARDARGFTPLIFAAYFDNELATNILLDHGAAIDARDGSGNTALIGVSFKGNVSIANDLIARGADVNAQNNEGTTPLIFAATYGRTAMVDLLLQHGAEKLKVDNANKSARDHAKEKQFDSVLELLSP